MFSLHLTYIKPGDAKVVDSFPLLMMCHSCVHQALNQFATLYVQVRLYAAKVVRQMSHKDNHASFFLTWIRIAQDRSGWRQLLAPVHT